MPRKVSKTISASVLSAKRNSANRDAAASRASVTKVPTGGRLDNVLHLAQILGYRLQRKKLFAFKIFNRDPPRHAKVRSR